MDSNYCCTGCESESLAWEETSIDRCDAAGIANGQQRTRGKARELRDQLKQHFARSNQPIWVAVQNRGEQDPDQYWIGRALHIVKEYVQLTMWKAWKGGSVMMQAISRLLWNGLNGTSVGAMSAASSNCGPSMQGLVTLVAD